MEVFMIYPVFIGISLVVAQLARQKGYSGRWWFLIATILPIISIFLIFLMKKRERTYQSVEPDWAKQNIPNDKVIYTQGK